MNTLRSLMVGILMLLAVTVVPVTALAAFDTTQPTTSATLTGTKGNDGWYTTSVTVTLVAADGTDGSGVAKTEYSLDNVTWQTYSAPLVLDKEGKQYVYFRSTDNAGNLETPAKSQEIKINKTGLVGLWHMDGDWKDASVMGNSGTPYNGATFSTNAKIGIEAGSFDGVNDYASFGNVLNMGSNNFTIAAWINVAEFVTGAGSKILNKGLTANGTPPNAGFGLRIINEGGLNKAKFMVFGIGTGYVVEGSGLEVGQWYHVVGVREGTSIKLYINGVLAATKDTGSLLNTDTNINLAIGALQRQPFSVDGEFFHGLIDEASIYNRALSATDIQSQYRNYVVNTPTVNPVPSSTATPTITLSGTKSANTAIVVNGNTLVPLDATTNWQAPYTLLPGTNNLTITALNGQNFKSLPVMLSVVLDSTPPLAPGIDPATAPINTTSKTITGT
ncbi:MAG: LamG domain-containing protein, partial [Desulfuromonadaceae bacterium]